MAARNDKPGVHLAESSPRKPGRRFPYHRHLKVYPGIYYYPFTTLPQPHRPPVPWIRLKGYWLNEAGFDVDTPLRVEVSEGRIVLTIDPDR